MLPTSSIPSTSNVIDRQAVEHSFREWDEEQALLDAQLAESMTALEAYQSNLDAWQQELAREREALRQEREAFARDQSGAGTNHEQLQVLSNQLAESREQNNSLTAALLQRTEELRTLDHQREEAYKELALARAHEQELTIALATQQQSFEAERLHWEPESIRQREQLEKVGEVGAAARNAPAKPDARTSTSPVLGSVMEQFGKLRQQRSLNRPNPNPR